MTDAVPLYADARFWLFLVAWLIYATFVVLYAFRSPWWTNWLSRSLLLSYSVIAVLITDKLVVLLAGREYVGALAVRSFLIGGVIVAGLIQVTYLIRAQKEARAAPPSPRRRATDL